jgi:hypothetical protein
MRSHSFVNSAFVVLAFMYAVGLLLGALSLAWEAIFRGGLPQMPWWQWLLTPLGIGAFAMGGEWLFEKVQEKTGFGAPGQPRLTHAIHLLVLLIVMALIILGPALYTIARQ